MEYFMVLDPCVTGHEPACYEVWHDTGDFDFELIAYIGSDSPEVFAAACFNV